MSQYKSNNENAGISVHREAIHLTLGGIYLNKNDNCEYQLVNFIDTQEASFKNLKTLIVEQLSIHDFINTQEKAHTVVSLDMNAINDNDWKKAQFKLDAISPFIETELAEEYSGRQGLAKRAEECKVSVRTLQRWLSAYEKTNSIASLIERKRGWTDGSRRITDKQLQLIDEVINSYYLTIQRPTIESTIREVFKRCFERKIQKPSKNSIRYQIGRINEKDFLKARGYRERAKNKFTPKVGNFPTVYEPLAVIQIDHTPADIILVDDEYRKPIGRPYITVAIDIYSRMITGYYISLDAPSVTSVAMCVARSILPKQELLLQHDITDVTWDVYGIPKKIHVDNGSDFRSESFKRSCMMHGINLEFRPLARPEFGGHIERLIGSLMKKVHELPGTTFSNVHKKDNYDSEKHASLTLDEFEKWFLTYITKEYHQKIHSALGCSLAKQWKIGLFGDDTHTGIGLPSLPSDAQTLILDFMPIEERTIQHTGVMIDGLHYYDPCLNPHINAIDEKTGKKKKFIFRRDPRDISNLWFFDPDLEKYFKIPFANQALPAMSKWEYEALKKQVKERSGAVNDALIYQAWNEMQELVEEAKKNTKTLRRQEQRRKTHIKSQQYHQPVEQESEKLIDDVPNSQTIPIEFAFKPIASPITNNNSIITQTNDDDLDYYEDIE